MEFDFQGFQDFVVDSLKILLGDPIPPLVSRALAILALLVAFLLSTFIILWLFTKVIELFDSKIKPYFYNVHKKQKQRRRQFFAGHILYEIRGINNSESWEDHRFTELEAEVEAQGKRVPWLSILPQKDTLTREKSLSDALRKTTDKLVLLEGDPGSGKSVALRFLAKKLAEKAEKSRNLKEVIPLYINLKEIKRNDSNIDQNLIKSYVLEYLNRVNSRDVQDFLENEFDRGLQNGTWIFLFDSFDEIPEVISSVESDEIIHSYANAINDFLLNGFNQCRGIVASREYRGPKFLDVPSFRILPLTEHRQKQLIKRIDFGDFETNKLIGELANSPQSFRAMASNPMFLSLLSDYVKQSKKFPENSYLVYENYIDSRFKRDENRLKQSFGLNASKVREAAESLAFCMTAEYGLSLSPSRKELKKAINHQNISLDSELSKLLDALEFIKIGRAETITTDQGVQKTFTFSHRRFQEFFATALILRGSKKVNSRELLTNGKWRESAVVILQTQSEEDIQELLVISNEIVKTAITDLECQNYSQTNIFCQSEAEIKHNKREIIIWPKEFFHVLKIIQDGLILRNRKLSGRMLQDVDDTLMFGMDKGSRLDNKLCLEVSGVASQRVQEEILKYAFSLESYWLEITGYKQIHFLEKINIFFSACIRESLLSKALSGDLYKNKQATKTYIQRINDDGEIFDAFQLIALIPSVASVIKIISFLVIFSLRQSELASFLENHTVYRFILDSFLWFYLFDCIQNIFRSLILRTYTKFSRLGVSEAFISIVTPYLILVSFIAMFVYTINNAEKPETQTFIYKIVLYTSSFLSNNLEDFSNFIGLSWAYLGVSALSLFWQEAAISFYEKGAFLKKYWWPFHIFIPIIKVFYEIISAPILRLLASVKALYGLLKVSISAVIPTSKRNIINLVSSISLILFTFFSRHYLLDFITGIFNILSNLPYEYIFNGLTFLFTFIFMPIYLSFFWEEVSPLPNLQFQFYYAVHQILLRAIRRSGKAKNPRLKQEIKSQAKDLDFIFESLERGMVTNLDSLLEIINILENRLDRMDIKRSKIQSIQNLALEIENSFPNVSKLEMVIEEKKFRGYNTQEINEISNQYFENKHLYINSIDAHISKTNLSSLFIFLDNKNLLHGLEKSPSNNIYTIELLGLCFSDLKALEDFRNHTGKLPIDLSNPIFSFLSNNLLVDELYQLAEKAKTYL